MPEITVNQARYHYEEYGTGPEIIIMSHGFLMDGEMFRYQTPYFSSRYRMVTFDWRGQGKSEATPTGYDMENLYKDAVEFIQQISPDTPVHWVGVSMGGFIGLRIAARDPELLKSLVVANTSAEDETFLNKLKWGTLSYIFKYAGVSPILNGIKKALFGKTKLHDPDFQPIIREYAEKWKKLDKNATFQTAWGIFNRPGITEELPKIKIPVLIMVGEEDMSRSLEESFRMKQRIPHALLATIPKAGHSSPLEQPEFFNTKYDNFLQSF